MEQTELTQEQIVSVKKLGFLLNRGTRNFNGRIITKNGVVTAEQMAVIAQAAEKFGAGVAALTVRTTIEVPGIAFENIQPFRDFIAKAGLETGGTGALVRPVVSCKGSTCVYGLYDTMGTAKEVHERFYEGYRTVRLPHKFKIAVGGCPNNCAKPDLNDVGVVGQRVIRFEAEKCKGCKKCAITLACPTGAARLEDGKIVIDKERCNNCGRCFQKCYFNVNETAEDRFKIYVGGRWGKQIRIGDALGRLFTREEMMQVVEKAILLFRSEGKPGERFAQTIDRIGIECAEALLLSDELLRRKEEIIAEAD